MLRYHIVVRGGERHGYIYRSGRSLWRTVAGGNEPGQRRKLEPGDPAAIGEKVKASMAWREEIMGLRKVRYRGLTKNTERRAVARAIQLEAG